MTTHSTHISGSQFKSISRIEISGNTFAHKDAIKAAGGRWDAARKIWTITVGSATGARRNELSNLTLALRGGCTFRSA